jgi:hypothetical protein
MFTKSRYSPEQAFMLDNDVYTKIGTFILEFNQLEFVLELALVGLLCCRDNDVGDMVVSRQAFNSKLEWADQLASHYADKYPDIKHVAAAFMRELKRAKPIADRRNQLAHSLITLRSGSDEQVLVKLKRWNKMMDPNSWTAVAIDLITLQQGITEADEVGHLILETYGALREALHPKWFPS